MGQPVCWHRDERPRKRQARWYRRKVFSVLALLRGSKDFFIRRYVYDKTGFPMAQPCHFLNFSPHLVNFQAYPYVKSVTAPYINEKEYCYEKGYLHRPRIDSCAFLLCRLFQEELRLPYRHCPAAGALLPGRDPPLRRSAASVSGGKEGHHHHRGNLQRPERCHPPEPDRHPGGVRGL